ncbi:MAG: helicase C-terminal domain-containing protein [Candidatus Nitrosopolaris sp.]
MSLVYLHKSYRRKENENELIRINEKRTINGKWYIWQTALKLVQGYGRSIRSKEDWAKTYVLDSAFGLFLEKNKNILPDWFTQAIQGRIKIIS